jgi:hypothetical protein
MAELFANFEVNREPKWPIISRLLAGSVAVHLLAVICVLYVPGIRDAFNIASLIAGTNYVDRDYSRTEIGDEVRLVDVSRQKFRYPDGYFAVEGQPAELAAFIPPPLPPQIITPVPSMPIFKPAPEASPTPSPTATPSPSPLGSSSPAQAIAKADSGPVQNEEKKSGQQIKAEQAQTELEQTVAKNNLALPKENEINKKALKDFAIYANDLKNRGQLDLNKPFEIVIEAELDGNGKLKDPKFIKKEGDANLVDLFGRMVGALNDSGFLVYLKPIDKDNPGSKVVFTIKQGESEVLATVESEASSVDSARVLAKGFNAALSIGAESRAGKDEEVLLRNTSAAPLGKKLIFNFTMPRQALVDLIKKQLAS